MLDIGWSELLVIGVVALIVVGPKDLPVMFRTLGRFTGKMRGMARDFQRAMDDAAKSAGVDEVTRDLKAMTSKKSLGLDALESAASKFEKWDPVKNAARPTSAVTAPVTPIAPAGDAAAKSLGPATQALADKQAKDRTEIAAKASAARMAKAVSVKAPDDTQAQTRRPASVTAGAKAKTARSRSSVKVPVAEAPTPVRKPAPRKSKPAATKAADA